MSKASPQQLNTIWDLIFHDEWTAMGIKLSCPPCPNVLSVPPLETVTNITQQLHKHQIPWQITFN